MVFSLPPDWGGTFCSMSARPCALPRQAKGFRRVLVVFLRLPGGLPPMLGLFRVCVSVAVFLSTETSL